jgi:hypothetical protein
MCFTIRTDEPGASRYAERHGHSWVDLIGVLDQEGPDALIARVRRLGAEAPASSLRGRRHDDASAVLWRI